jgi:hypothetical protein
MELLADIVETVLKDNLIDVPITATGNRRAG